MQQLIRKATPDDLDEILLLCAEHAAYERASFQPEHKKEKLHHFLFGEKPVLHCFIAIVNERVAGYATYSLEVSTWDAWLYAHMDCLFVRSEFRSQGLGEKLVQQILQDSQASLLQWQTPAWNEQAIKFYHRIGASAKEKLRFYLTPEHFVMRTP